MNINECGCRPYGWLGLDGDRCIRVIPRHEHSMLFHMLITITVIAASLKLPIENNSIVKNFYSFKNQRALSVIDARCYASNEEYLYKAHSTFSTHSVSVAK